jgi:hypothetical protein
MNMRFRILPYQNIGPAKISLQLDTLNDIFRVVTNFPKPCSSTYRIEVLLICQSDGVNRRPSGTLPSLTNYIHHVAGGSIIC